jgi:hypothetical protein
MTHVHTHFNIPLWLICFTSKGKIKKRTENGQSMEIYDAVSLATLDTMLQCALSYTGGVQDDTSGRWVWLVLPPLVVTLYRRKTHWEASDRQISHILEVIYLSPLLPVTLRCKLLGVIIFAISLLIFLAKQICVAICIVQTVKLIHITLFVDCKSISTAQNLTDYAMHTFQAKSVLK